MVIIFSSSFHEWEERLTLILPYFYEVYQIDQLYINGFLGEMIVLLSPIM